jgi:hypothetical protein
MAPIDPTDIEHPWAKKFVDRLKERCRECGFSKVKGRGKWGVPEVRVDHPSGFWFEVTVDPAALELKTAPMTIAERQKNSKVIQKLLFDIPEEMGLHSRDFFTGLTDGHLNIGVRSAFKDDGKAMARYLSHEWSYPELYHGAMGNPDVVNAPLLNSSEGVLQGKVQDLNTKWNQRQGLKPGAVAEDVLNVLYAPSGSVHYQQIGLKYVPAKPTLPGADFPIELRNFRTPPSLKAWDIQERIVEARIQLALKSKGPIEFLPRSVRSTYSVA